MKSPRVIMALVPAWLVGLGLAAAGCSTPLAKPQYLAYLADPQHGLTQTQEVNGTTITCSYRPLDLQVSQDLSSRTALASPAAVDSIRRIYADKVYCTLSLQRGGAEIENSVITDEAALGQVLSYLSAGIAPDVTLRGAAQPDSAAALAALYARQYGSTGRSTVLLIFAAPKAGVESGLALTYHDTQFQLGTVRFLFPAAAIHKLPALAF